MKIRWLLIILLVVICPVIGKGQYTITGIIKDSTSREPYPWAFVTIIDYHGNKTRIGTATQPDGRFTLSIPEDYNNGVKLEISALGFRFKKIFISKKELIEKSPSDYEIYITQQSSDCPEDMIVIVKPNLWNRIKHKLFGTKNYKK